MGRSKCMNSRDLAACPSKVGHGGISIAFKIAYKDTSHAEGAANL